MEKKVSWNDLWGTSEIFKIWVDGFEKEWGEKAWEILESQGLTTYTDQLEYTRVLIRFLCLGIMYHEFCYFAWDEGPYVELLDWARSEEINSFRVAQLVGEDFEKESNLSEEELLEEALKELILQEHPKVYRALVKGFGGKSKLFASLWLTAGEHVIEEDEDLEEWEDEEEEEMSDEWIDDESSDDEWLEENVKSRKEKYRELLENERVIRSILNDVSYDKLRAYSWVEEGMPVEISF